MFGMNIDDSMTHHVDNLVPPFFFGEHNARGNVTDRGTGIRAELDS